MSKKENTEDIEWGVFDGKIPYVKVGSGAQRLVYFSGGGALLSSVGSDPIGRGRAKKKLLTPDQTMYILGYPRDVSGCLSLENFADMLAHAIQDHLGKSIIIGNSFGGLIAIIFAAKHPDLTEKLIITNAAYSNSPKFIVELQKIMKLGKRGKVLLMLLKMNFLIINPWLRGIENIATILSWPRIKKRLNPISEFIKPLASAISSQDSLKAYLPQIKAKTVIIGGTADKAHSEALFRETASLIPGAKLVLFPGYGHEMETEHGEEFREAFQKSLI
jgi:pimeloyl-ACP methyl ester carboxylesterase